VIVKRFLAAALVAAALLSSVEAEGGGLSWELDGVRFLYGFIPSGADVSFTYAGIQLSDAADTKLFLKAGGGYEDTQLLRDPGNGNPSPLADDGGTGFGFNKTDFQWELALLQGLARRGDGGTLVEAFAFYRGRYDYYPNDAYPDLVFTDMDGLFGTSFLGGFSFDSVVQDRHRSKDGVYAEASAEWGPGFLNAKSDFWQVSAQVRGFLPVFDIPTDGGNLFNIYLAGFVGIDYADGASVPIYVNQSFGGRDLRDSLGKTVRGYGWNAYDSSFKSVANAEVRFVGPRMLLDSIVPYLFGFVDAGFYSGFADASAGYADESGYLASSGGGIALDLVGFAQASIIFGLKLIDDQLYGPQDDFFWAIKFFLHF
jgi:hypothetical protein